MKVEKCQFILKLKLLKDYTVELISGISNKIVFIQGRSFIIFFSHLILTDSALGFISKQLVKSIVQEKKKNKTHFDSRQQRSR